MSKCLGDLFFFETLLNAEYIPSFGQSNKHGHYLNLIYQHYYIKSVTCFDCVLHSLNKTFELGLPDKAVSTLTVKENDHVKDMATVMTNLVALDSFLTRSISNVCKENIKATKRSLRNRIVHGNIFSEPLLSILQGYGDMVNNPIFEIDNIQFQFDIANKSSELVEIVKKDNQELFPIVYELFKSMHLEYTRRFNEKLIK